MWIYSFVARAVLQRPNTGFMCEFRVGISEKSTKIFTVNNSFFEVCGMASNIINHKLCIVESIQLSK